MKLRPKFKYDAYHFQNSEIDKLKRWLIDHNVEVLKIIEMDDNGEYNVELDYKNEIGELNQLDFKNDWWIIINEFNILESCSEEYKKENYEEVNGEKND